MKTVNQSMRKKDAMQLLTGQPVYTDDLAPKDCLVVKLLRSPHANAWVEQIDTAAALRVPGVEAVFTWQDVPQEGPRYTQAGQTYPEPSPHDRLVIDRHVRFVGDVVAIVAARDEQAADKALKCIKVQYQVLEPVLDFRTAKDNPILVHPEENWESLCPVGADNKRNLCAHDESGEGDIEAVLAGCDVVIDHTYHTRACQQAMMETFRTYCSIDAYGRLNVLSSTQIVFHCRRILANALHIPKSMIRVAKRRCISLNPWCGCPNPGSAVVLAQSRRLYARSTRPLLPGRPKSLPNWCLPGPRARRRPPPGTRWSCTSAWALTAVTLTSRSAALSCCPTAPARPSASAPLPRALLPLLLRQPALTSWAMTS